MLSKYINELKFMAMSQPGIKSNIFYCHIGLVLMNAIATQVYKIELYKLNARLNNFIRIKHLCR